MKTNQDPRRKGPDKDAPPRKDKRSPEEQSAGEKPDAQPAGDRPSKEEVISTWSDPVTNQDEQEKITNAGGGDIPMPDK